MEQRRRSYEYLPQTLRAVLAAPMSQVLAHARRWEAHQGDANS